MKQLDLTGEDTREKKKTKKGPKKPRKNPQPWGGGFFGDVVPIPTHEGHAIACPCGRIQLLKQKGGKLFFYDREGALGDARLRARKSTADYIAGERISFSDSDSGIEIARQWITQLGCQLHFELISRRISVPASLQGFRPTPYR